MLWHDGLWGATREAVKVKLHAVAHSSHAIHVKELLEIFLGRRRHIRVVPIPTGGAHHGGSEGCPRDAHSLRSNRCARKGDTREPKFKDEAVVGCAINKPELLSQIPPLLSISRLFRLGNLFLHQVALSLAVAVLERRWIGGPGRASGPRKYRRRNWPISREKEGTKGELVAAAVDVESARAMEIESKTAAVKTVFFERVRNPLQEDCRAEDTKD